jgi:hypothetical protein
LSSSQTHTVTEKQARDVKVGDHVMSPIGPRRVTGITRTKTGRLELRYGPYTGNSFRRDLDEPVFTCPAPVKAEEAPDWRSPEATTQRMDPRIVREAP